jgi:hypothetical protein
MFLSLAGSAACSGHSAPKTFRPARATYQILEFDERGSGCEVPIGFGVVGISILLPGTDFIDERLLVGDAAIEALLP